MRNKYNLQTIVLLVIKYFFNKLLVKIDSINYND